MAQTASSASNNNENDSLLPQNASSKASFDASDIQQYGDGTNKDDIEMLERMQSALTKEVAPNIKSSISIDNRDIEQYEKEFKHFDVIQEDGDDEEKASILKDSNEENSDDKIMSGDTDTGLRKEKTTLEQDVAKYDKNKNDEQHPKRNRIAEMKVVTNQCCDRICNPEIEIVKDEKGRHEGILRCYGKSFSYKQIVCRYHIFSFCCQAFHWMLQIR